MSVPVNKRTHGKLEAYTKAYDLAVYTLQITGVKKMALLERKKIALSILADIENAAASAGQNAINIEDVMNAIVELGDIVAAQDDAIVELAEIISE